MPRLLNRLASDTKRLVSTKIYSLSLLDHGNFISTACEEHCNGYAINRTAPKQRAFLAVKNYSLLHTYCLTLLLCY